MGVFPGFGSWINQNSQQPLKVSLISPIIGADRWSQINIKHIFIVCSCRPSPRDLKMANLSRRQRKTLIMLLLKRRRRWWYIMMKKRTWDKKDFGIKQRRSIHGVIHLPRSRYEKNITQTQYNTQNLFALVKSKKQDPKFFYIFLYLWRWQIRRVFTIWT